MDRKIMRVEGLCVDVSILVQGPLQNNVYIISDGQGTFVVDPTANADEIVAALEGKPLDAIVITHAHWDHTGACERLRALTGARVIASAIDAPDIEVPKDTGTSRIADPCVVDETVSHADVVKIGDMPWKVIHTPGHTKGSMCLFLVPQFGNHTDGLPVLISGDTLFQGSCGRMDFEGGSEVDMAASMKKLAALPDDTVVLPGHGNLTTIGNERRTFARFGSEPLVQS